MPEYSFNPVTGQGEAVGRSADSAPPSAQEQSDVNQQRSFNNTANHLSERAAQKAGTDAQQFGGGDLEVEIKLQEVQQELHRRTNGQLAHDPLRVLQLEALATQLAASLVGESTAPAEPEPLVEDQESNDEILDIYPNFRETLQFAADNLPNESAAEWNTFLQSDNKHERQCAAAVLDEFQKNPDSFTTAPTPLSEADVAAIESELGAEAAHEVITVNAALAAGHASPQDVMSLAMKSPSLYRSIKQLASKGLISISL